MERLKNNVRREPKQSKISAVENLAKELKASPAIAILNMHKLPASALQKIKYELGDSAKVRFTKKSSLMFAIKKAGKEHLIDHFKEQPALLLTDMNPFKLYKFIMTNKSPTSAKAGDIAPHDIEVKAGPTDLMPGPAITTLTKAGVPAKIEGGKIAVRTDKVVCKAGEKITLDMAAALQLLKLQPMEIALDVVAIAEGDLIYAKSVLAVDEKKLMANIALAVSQAVNLSVNAGWPTKQTMPIMINKAFLNAKTLGIEANVLDKGIIDSLLAKGKLQAECLNAKIKV